MTKQTGEQLLQEKYNTTKRAYSFYNNQMLDYVNEQMQEFISNQEMVFIATSDREGNCDSSFKSGEKGFVRIIDDKTLIYPEYKGNGVMASLGNLTENSHIGLMFIDFFEHGIGLHVNGKAVIMENEQVNEMHFPVEIFQSISSENKAERWVRIDVDEAYIHCSKHIPILEKKIEKNVSIVGDFFQVKQSKNYK